MQMLEASRTVPYPRKAWKVCEGYGSDYYSVSAIYHFQLPCFGVLGCLASDCFQGSVRSLYFQQVFWVVLDSISGQTQQRSRAQFGLAPHLSTNFRVSRTPNRRTALPWQQLTAKSSVYHLIGAPNNQSPRHTADYGCVFLTWKI